MFQCSSWWAKQKECRHAWRWHCTSNKFLIEVSSVNVNKSTVPTEYTPQQFVREYTSNNTVCTIIYGQQQCVREYMCNKNAWEYTSNVNHTRVTGNNNAYENIEAAARCTRINEQPQCVQDYTKNNHVHENIRITTRYNNKRYVDIRICFTQCGRNQ